MNFLPESLQGTARRWAVPFALLLLTLVLVPLLRMLPVDSALHPSDYTLTWLGKIMCYMLAALALDMAWGVTGILSLGHGLYFALGGYMMGMHLMREIGRDGVYKSDLPDFMVFLDWKEMPWFWTGSEHFWVTLLQIVLVPGIVAFVFGFFAFRSRIKGVYLSIITQALTYAALLLFFRNETGFGGNNGFTDFKRILGVPLAQPGTRTFLFALTGFVLVLSLLLCGWILRSRYGRILTAVRDAESRLLFCGYDTLWFKLSVWTFSAVLCGIAGALYVPQVGIINPSEMSVGSSIEMAVWVAVGGRGSLVGALLGAGLVNGAKSWFTAVFPDIWLYFLGALFILTTLFLPQGILGLYASLRRKLSKSGGAA
ncbi:MAG: hypothetical protein RL318_1558 [Fibrobacterota bacterium]|jgi:urea transport system permease protein